jgi:hypothetical protein
VWRKVLKALKWLGGTVGFYALFVVIFEAGYLGYAQPSFEDSGIPMLVLTTTSPSGETKDTMLARITVGENIYVSAHHWSRGWHSNAIKNPEVLVTIDGARSARKAVPVEGLEFQNAANALPLNFPVRFLMGFPLAERQILRLDEV